MIEQIIDEIRHVERGEHNYYLNIRCYQGYFYFTYIQNNDYKSLLPGIHFGERDLLTGLQKTKTLLDEEGYRYKGDES